MAKPTDVSDVFAELAYVVNLFNQVEKFANANTGNYLAMYEDVAAHCEGDFIPLVVDALGRANLSAILSDATLRKAGEYFLSEFARVLDLPETTPSDIMARLPEEFEALAVTINSRNFTFDSITADPGNVGDGTVLRCSVTELGYPIENICPDTWEAECIQDSNETAIGEEMFEIRSGRKDLDDLTRSGQGTVTKLTGVTARTASSYIVNPSFTSGAGIGASLVIPGWTLDDPLHFEHSTNTYRSYKGEGTGYSLKQIAAGDCYQKPRDQKETTYSGSKPWHISVALYRGGTADGSVTLEWGTISDAVVMATQADGTWARYTIPVDQGIESWYEAWKETDFALRFSWDGTTGYVEYDDLVVAPYTEIAGHWFVALGGPTLWTKGDKYTWENHEGAPRAKFAYWLWRMGWPQIPTNNAGAESVIDPADPV